MKLKSRSTLTVPLALVAAGAVAALADTLVLRGGRSVKGELISFRNGEFEFRNDRGRTERYSIDDVDRIEFSRGGGSIWDNDRDRPGSSGRPNGLREREVDVRGAEAWTRTGIELQDGQQIWFDSRGEVRWGPGRKDGPGGESGSPRNPARPIPNRPGAALIGKLGENGDPFFIGADAGPIRVRGRGALFLGVNDDYLQDNSGGFRVTVYY